MLAALIENSATQVEAIAATQFYQGYLYDINKIEALRTEIPSCFTESQPWPR